MRSESPSRQTLVRRGIQVLFSVVLFTGCGSTPATSPPAEGPSSAPSSTAAPSVGASTAPGRSPLPGFVTKEPTAVDATWKSLTWRELAADDPLARVRSMIRWGTGGFMAVGEPEGTGDTSMTPVWLSGDGATWPSSTAVFGPAAVVVAAGQSGARTTVLTLEGGPNSCGDDATLGCWTLAEPLTSWTSVDGANWTSNPGPDLALAEDCDTCGITPPIVRFGRPGALAVSSSADGVTATLSRDGINWEVLPSDTFPSAFQVGDVAAFGAGFVAVGALGSGDTAQAAAFQSADGRSWTPRTLPIAPSVEGSLASQVLVGSSGLIAVGSETAVPGRALWWTSSDGSDWTARPKYAPLGVWKGEGEGSGLIPDGNVVADGTRMLAYRTDGGVAAWTSGDGRSWKPLDVSGASASAANDWPLMTLYLLPVGVLWLADDGTAWFGEPGA